MSTREIKIVEVGPRDGLQSEPEILLTDSKVLFIEKAIEAGIRRLEVASFVHPKLVPQMADAEALIEKLPEIDGVSYIGLIMNERIVLYLWQRFPSHWHWASLEFLRISCLAKYNIYAKSAEIDTTVSEEQVLLKRHSASPTAAISLLGWRQQRMRSTDRLVRPLCPIMLQNMR